MVRPLCGLDNFCEETLESSFRLDYPSYEIIFCVARATDLVLPLVHRLIAKYPDRPARLIVGDEKVSANPKLNNCVRGWDAASHDWIILTDANVLMPRDCIQRLLAGWRRRTGLVCSMPLGSRPRNLWAELECAFLNTFEARWQYCAEAVGLGFAQGKSMLWRRDIMEAGGGIRALGAEIAEDAASTKLVRRQGSPSISSIVRSNSRSAFAAFAMSGCGRFAGRECGAKLFRFFMRLKSSREPRCLAWRRPMPLGCWI